MEAAQRPLKPTAPSALVGSRVFDFVGILIQGGGTAHPALRLSLSIRFTKNYFGYIYSIIRWMILIGKDVRVGVCLYAGEMESMVRFYRDTLGLHTQWDGGDFAEFETASGALSLFMYSRKAFVQAIGESYVPPKGINQTFEVALWLPCFSDVDKEYIRLAKLGVRFPTGEPRTFSFGIRNFYVADPEGNLLEIGSANET